MGVLYFSKPSFSLFLFTYGFSLYLSVVIFSTSLYLAFSPYLRFSQFLCAQDFHLYLWSARPSSSEQATKHNRDPLELSRTNVANRRRSGDIDGDSRKKGFFTFFTANIKLFFKWTKIGSHPRSEGAVTLRLSRAL